MLNKRISLIALGMLSATQPWRTTRPNPGVFVKTAASKCCATPINRDFKDGNPDKSSGARPPSAFSSGFTQGTVWVWYAFLYALN